MRQADKNRVGKAYELVEIAEEKLRKIKLGNMDVRQKFCRIRALENAKNCARRSPTF